MKDAKLYLVQYQTKSGSWLNALAESGELAVFEALEESRDFCDSAADITL